VKQSAFTRRIRGKDHESTVHTVEAITTSGVKLGAVYVGLCDADGKSSRVLFEPEEARRIANAVRVCRECDGRGWHVGECHPQEECGACFGTGEGLSRAVADYIIALEKRCP
jgi:hypothetical protein